jgi:hypothetical protein
MSDTLVRARWIGPFDFQIGGITFPYGHIMETPRVSAEKSGHWEILDEPAQVTTIPPVPVAPVPPTPVQEPKSDSDTSKVESK